MTTMLRQQKSGGGAVVGRYRRAHHTGHGSLIVREQYLRDDIPCCSPLCESDACASALELAPNPILLPDDATHYIIPDDEVARRFPSMLQHADLSAIILPQTSLQAVKHHCSRRQALQLTNHFRDKRNQCIIFPNENHEPTWEPRQGRESDHAYAFRLVHRLASWYHTHLNNKVPVVLLTYGAQPQPPKTSAAESVEVLDVATYLQRYHSDSVTLWDEFKAEEMETEEAEEEEAAAGRQGARGAGRSDVGYIEYLDDSALLSGINTDAFVRGRITVFKGASKAVVRHHVTAGDAVSSLEEVFIEGRENINRAVHGDIVVVQRPTETAAARVVGITSRGFRDLVATIQERDADHAAGNKVLVVPFDARMPKIRVPTSNPAALKAMRLVVRIDAWPTTSRYPRGHITRVLGNAGDVATETQALLIENTIAVPPFSKAQMREMPVNTPQKRWQMPRDEVNRRRDIRSSHLVFSIDPLGCEDVDDALGVRRLPNGNLELSVHIADVSYFVRAGSFTDAEARSRGTTVYLVNGRYDMLPAVLSADLCSLLANQDRFAMSVFWELDPDCNVVSTWFGRTVIRSSYQLHYELAQALFDGMRDDTAMEQVPGLSSLDPVTAKTRLQELRDAISLLITTARRLKSHRADAGGLELESDEVRFKVSARDPEHVHTLLTKESLEIHGVVAECMIFANRAVAERISTIFPNRALLRHHPLPDADKFKRLAEIAESRGVTIDFTSNVSLAASLDAIRATGARDLDRVLRILATEAMTEAAYFSTGDIPVSEWFHYGLGLEHYTHFTSPIRRYADVVVHRQLMASLAVHPNTAAAELPDGVDRSRSDRSLSIDGAGDRSQAAHTGEGEEEKREKGGEKKGAGSSHKRRRHQQQQQQQPQQHPLLSAVPHGRDLSDTCAHINTRNRCAKAVQRDSVALFQALYIKHKQACGQSTRAPAIVLRVSADAVTLYAQEYGLRVRVRFSPVENAAVDGALFEVPAGLFAPSAPTAVAVARSRVVESTALELTRTDDGSMARIAVLDMVEVELSVDDSPYRPPDPVMRIVAPTQDRVSAPVDMHGDRAALVARIDAQRKALQKNSGMSAGGGQAPSKGKRHGPQSAGGDGEGDGESVYDILQRFQSLAMSAQHGMHDDEVDSIMDQEGERGDTGSKATGERASRKQAGGRLPPGVVVNRSGVFSLG